MPSPAAPGSADRSPNPAPSPAGPAHNRCATGWCPAPGQNYEFPPWGPPAAPAREQGAHRPQLCGAPGTASGMPLQLVTRVIGQFVVEIKRNVFPYPVAIHKNLLHFATSDRPAPTLTSGCAEQGVLRRLFRCVQGLADGAQLQTLVV